MTREIENKCRTIDFNQWSPWLNSYEVDNDGNDFEFRENHPHLSDCKTPIYIEAREVKSKISWVGSLDKLIFPVTASGNNWALGVSTQMGYDFIFVKTP